VYSRLFNNEPELGHIGVVGGLQLLGANGGND
jgi:hypothetical protein